MKIILATALLFLGSMAHASSDCAELAFKATAQLYLLNNPTKTIHVISAVKNSKNSTNAVSLILKVNEVTKYLVALTGDSQTRECTSVDYVISYPYADLMPQ